MTFETVHRRKDGTTFPVEARAGRFEQGGKFQRLTLARDISERKQAQDELRASEARSLEMQRIAHVGWWERDFSTQRVSLSDEVRRIFGVEPVDLPDWHERWLGLIHPEDRERAAEASAAAMRGEGRYDVEYRIVRSDGSLRVVHSQGDVIRDEEGSPKRQFGVLQDISALREAERELRSSEARFRTFVDHAIDAFPARPRPDHSRRRSPGVRQSRLQPGRTDRHAPARFRRRPGRGVHRAYAPAYRLRRSDHLRNSASAQDGTAFPVEIRAAKFKQGGQRRHLTLVRDISERKRAEEALQQRDAKIRRLVDANIIGIFVEEYDGRIVEANDAFLHMLGLGREDLPSGINWRQLTPPEWRARSEEAALALDVAGAAPPYEKEFFRKGGDRVPVLIGLARIDGGSKEYCFVLDLAERKRAEEALKESEDRFRALVQFSFDVYWESDAEHRFTRQEFANGLADAPEPGSEIGKRRWEVPYLEPDEDTWRRHRETLDAHLPFRDFELVRPAPDGGKRYVSVSGLPVFDQVGHFLGYRGVGWTSPGRSSPKRRSVRCRCSSPTRTAWRRWVSSPRRSPMR